MRTFKRLFPVSLALVLLAGVAPARPAGVAGTSRSPAVGISKPQFSHIPSPPRLDFGTVVRDTADEDALDPGHGEIPYILQQQVPQGTTMWNSVFAWVRFSLLLFPR